MGHPYRRRHARTQDRYRGRQRFVQFNHVRYQERTKASYASASPPGRSGLTPGQRPPSPPAKPARSCPWNAAWVPVTSSRSAHSNFGQPATSKPPPRSDLRPRERITKQARVNPSRHRCRRERASPQNLPSVAQHLPGARAGVFAVHKRHRPVDDGRLVAQRLLDVARRTAREVVDQFRLPLGDL